jgi:hypothetical protein
MMKVKPMCWHDERRPNALLALTLVFTTFPLVTMTDAADALAISWADNMLTIAGEQIPGNEIQVWYLEAYCRPGSTDRDWRQTTIGHTTRLVSAADDRRKLKLECRLNDGVIVRHTITANQDEVDFRLVARNPTDTPSQAHWAQPCMRVDRFTGSDQQTYLARSFMFLAGTMQRMPTQPWATSARYTPGQVWAPKNVNRADVNPRPLNALPPDNGLIGCFSADDKTILATAWEPYQELFQGVIVCLHADFRIGGLGPGEEKQIRGKIYVVPNDLKALLARYQRDFPEQTPKTQPTGISPRP